MSYKSVKMDTGATNAVFGKVTISLGNSKIGRTPNISLPPILSCPKRLPCYRDCYANGFYRRYKSVRQAWHNNWRAWLTDPKGFEFAVYCFLREQRPAYFRWHVGGDIPSMAYANMMFRLARQFPLTSFLAYTKRKWRLRRGRPENLTIIRSVWDAYSDHAGLDNREDRWAYSCSEEQALVIGATACPASVDKDRTCENCRLCWRGTGDVVFLL